MTGVSMVGLARRRAISRRRFLTALPFATGAAMIGVACATNQRNGLPGTESGQNPPRTSTPTPEPIVLPKGWQSQPLLGGTPYETPLHRLGSGRPGPVVLVLGGVHGNEPGGWLAAERLLESLEVARGSVLIVRRANKLATEAFARTLPELGDLNRLYPGDPSGPPMARMAYEIVQLIEQYRAEALIDMHESWGFYKDRAQRGTAFLGQTVSTYPNRRGPLLAKLVLEAVNRTTLQPREELFYREIPPRQFVSSREMWPWTVAFSSRSIGTSLGLGRRYPNMAAILVEMGQQQPLERRIDLHVQVVAETIRELDLA